MSLKLRPTKKRKKGKTAPRGWTRTKKMRLGWASENGLGGRGVRLTARTKETQLMSQRNGSACRRMWLMARRRFTRTASIVREKPSHHAKLFLSVRAGSHLFLQVAPLSKPRCSRAVSRSLLSSRELRRSSEPWAKSPSILAVSRRPRSPFARAVLPCPAQPLLLLLKPSRFFSLSHFW